MRRLEFLDIIPAPASEVWNFFSFPGNLGKITPVSMNFVIQTPLSGKMYPGMFIGYKVSPLPGMRISWVTEITHVSEGNYFVDEQRKGPYSIWHHEHHFCEVPGGIEMRDILSYRLPMGFLGKMIDTILVKKRVQAIFRFREQRIKELFPGNN